MRKLADWGVPQFVLPPHERPDLALLRSIGFSGSDAQVLGKAWKDAPALAAAACSASPMWAANAATVTPSADTADGRVHFTPANLLTNLHRSLEGEQTTRSLRRLFPDRDRFAVHEPLPAQSHFADEGAANHVRLCADHGEAGVNLFVWGREAFERWDGRYPARQTREAFEAVERRHDAARGVFARQARRRSTAGPSTTTWSVSARANACCSTSAPSRIGRRWRTASAAPPTACSSRSSSRSARPTCRWTTR